jgi:hypothetical protein
MKKLILPLAFAFIFGQLAMPTQAQTHHKPAHKVTKKKPLKNEISKLKRARKEDRTVRQVTINPKKNPAKDVSKNINNQLNRSSKDVNHWFAGKGNDKRKEGNGKRKN